MQRAVGFIVLFIICFHAAYAQKVAFHIQKDFKQPNSPFRNDTTPNKTKSKIVTGGILLGVGATSAYLIPAWYSKQDLGPFHFYEDWHQWQQLDKAGHMLGGYQGAKWMIDAYKWAGMSKKRAIIQGGTLAFMSMNLIEVMDGFGKSWGASNSDIAANALGSGLAMLNQALWNEYRIQRKYMYLPSIYTRRDSVAKYGAALGKNPQEWILKDYNGQVHWLSFRVHSFLPEGNFKDHYPRWLNLAVGYGGSGMIGRYYNPADPSKPWDPKEVIGAREYRKYYLAFDIDLSNIRTRSGVLNAFFQTFSIFRIPLPALEMDRFGARVGIR